MKTAQKNLKIGVLFSMLVILYSCNNITASSTIGINLVDHAIPAIAIKLTKYSETKIGEYMKRSTITEKGIKVKKVAKPTENPKIKPISISVYREARLV